MTTDQPQCTAKLRNGVRCARRGYGTYSHRGVRCWQHDPLRYVDEGEEAYHEHTAIY